MLSGLDRRHLLEQVLACDETHRGQEGDHTDSNGVVARIGIPIDDAVVLAILFPPTLGRYARENDYRKELGMI